MSAGRVGPVVARFALFLAIWLIFTGAEPAGLAFGVIAAGLATLVATSLSRSLGERHWPWRPAGWLRFGPWFLRRSFIGSLDVMRRAVLPSLPLCPDWVLYPLRLRDPAARHFMAATVGLLPGTLVAEIEGDDLRVHALDTGLDIQGDLAELEERVARLFAVSLAASGSGA